MKLHVSNLRPLPSFLIGSFALECTLTDIRLPNYCCVHCISSCTKCILHLHYYKSWKIFLNCSFMFHFTSHSILSLRPAGGRATWTATACDLISCYLTGASAIMTIKVSLLFYQLPPFVFPFLYAQLCFKHIYFHTVLHEEDCFIFGSHRF